MTQPLALRLKDMAAVTSAGQAPAVTLGAERSVARVTVDVSALAAGESVTLVFETALTEAGGYRALTNEVITQLGTHDFMLTGVQERLRVLWDVTAPATFGVTAISEQIYSSPADMQRLSLPATTLSRLTAADLAFASVVASDEATSYLGAHFDLPIKSWGNALRMHTANLAVYHAMRRRGFNPDADPLIRQGYVDAIAWLKGPASNDPSIVDTTPQQSSQTVYVVSDPPRGWQRW
jgi:phage gp36-like protein